MPVVGYVTRTFGSRTFSAAAAQGGAGGVGYTLRAANGNNLGSYKDVAAAQAAFGRFFGANRILKWVKQDLQGDIEQHVAIGLPLDPAEVWLEPLKNWIEPSQAPGSAILSNSALGYILVIKDLSGNGHQWVAAGSPPPTLVEDDPNFLSRLCVSTVRTVPNGFDVPTITSQPTPFTLAMMASNLDPTNNGILFSSDPGGIASLTVTDTGAGNWRVSVGASQIVGPATGADPALIVVEADGTNVRFRVNQVDIGSMVASPSSGNPPQIAGYSTDPFSGRISVFVLADEVDPSRQKVYQIERYMRSRY